MKFYTSGENLPGEVWDLLRGELAAQISLPIFPLDVYYGRRDLHRTVGLNPQEKLWDLRTRFTDFLRRFLICYRPYSQKATRITPDPFTVFFIEPRTLGSQPNHFHVRSGLFGHAYVIDKGQQEYLQSERIKDDTLPTDAIQKEYLPFPNGVCTHVYLTARSCGPEDVDTVIKRYGRIANTGELLKLEKTLLHDRSLMEVPIYDELPMLGGPIPDGPRLILCIALPNPSTDESFGGSDGIRDGSGRVVAANAPDLRIDQPAASPGDITDENGYLEALRPPSFSSYDLGEASIVREMAHKMTKRFLSPPASQDLSEIVGVSPAMLEVRREVMRVASKNLPVLITGESGTGKTFLASAIHSASNRAQKPFKKLPGRPDELFIGEIFGWKKDAHSTAHRDYPGIALSAEGGTLFIDDIDKLSPKAQGELLQFIDEKKFTPVGGTQEVKVDVRFITASNKPMDQLIDQGLFREDLYYRIARIKIHLRPLRERREDIPYWAERFLQEFALAGGRSTALTDEALEALRENEWPGNLRTLYDVLAKACDLAEDGSIRPEHLSLNPTR